MSILPTAWYQYFIVVSVSALWPAGFQVVGVTVVVVTHWSHIGHTLVTHWSHIGHTNVVVATHSRGALMFSQQLLGRPTGFISLHGYGREHCNTA